MSLLVLLLALVAVDPALTSSERSLLEQAVANQKGGRWEEAARGYQRLLDARPDFVPARIYLSESLWLAGEQERARRELARSREEAPHLMLSLLLASSFQGEEPEALAGVIPDSLLRARLLDVVRLEREKFVPVGLPAMILVSAGAIDAALADYRLVSDLDPGDSGLHRVIGSGLLKVRRPLEAAEALERAVALEPKEESSWRQLGSAYLFLTRWESAVEAYEKAIALGGEDASLFLALGYAYERETKFEKALELYRKAARLVPSSGQPYYRLGRLYMSRNELARAEEAFRRASSLEPNTPEVIAYLGALHLKQGRISDAIGELEHAVELDPESYEAYYHLAQAYRRMEREEDARRALALYEKYKRERGGRPR